MGDATPRSDAAAIGADGIEPHGIGRTRVPPPSRPPRIRGYEHLEAQSLSAGCVALLDGQPWQVQRVEPACSGDLSLLVSIEARRWVGRDLVRQVFLRPWDALCPVRVADAP